MSKQSEAITIDILDKQYTVSCPPEEKQSLLESAGVPMNHLR